MIILCCELKPSAEPSLCVHVKKKLFALPRPDSHGVNFSPAILHFVRLFSRYDRINMSLMCDLREAIIWKFIQFPTIFCVFKNRTIIIRLSDFLLYFLSLRHHRLSINSFFFLVFSFLLPTQKPANSNLNIVFGQNNTNLWYSHQSFVNFPEKKKKKNIVEVSQSKEVSGLSWMASWESSCVNYFLYCSQTQSLGRWWFFAVSCRPARVYTKWCWKSFVCCRVKVKKKTSSREHKNHLFFKKLSAIHDSLINFISADLTVYCKSHCSILLFIFLSENAIRLKRTSTSEATPSKATPPAKVRFIGC